MIRKENSLVPSYFRNFFLSDDDFWETDFTTPSGLSVYEDEQHVYIEADLPGLREEDIEITFEKGVLWIRGERKEEEKGKEKKYYRKASSSFSYRVLVPGLIDEKKEPEASYKEGVMTVTFEKSQQNRARKIKITKK